MSKDVLAGRSVAAVSFEIQTFTPTVKGDTRSLGMAVSAIELCSTGAENEPAAATPLALEVDWSQAEPCLRRIGRGATLTVAGYSLREFNAVVTEVMMHPERLIPGAQGSELPLVAVDGVFATKLRDSILFYNGTVEPHRVGDGEVPAHGIMEIKNGSNGSGGL